MNSLIDAVLTKWELTSEEHKELSKYFLLKWSPEYFNVYQKIGVIVRDGYEYQIIYHNCLPVHLEHAKQIALSFRKLYGMPYGYVLVKPWMEK